MTTARCTTCGIASPQEIEAVEFHAEDDAKRFQYVTRYGTIDHLHWKTDRQAASLI